MSETHSRAERAPQFSWKYPWGNRAHETRLAELLGARYLYVDPAVIVERERAEEAR